MRVNFVVPQETYTELEKVCQVTERTISNMLRHILKDYFYSFHQWEKERNERGK